MRDGDKCLEVKSYRHKKSLRTKRKCNFKNRRKGKASGKGHSSLTFVQKPLGSDQRGDYVVGGQTATGKGTVYKIPWMWKASCLFKPQGMLHY